MLSIKGKWVLVTGASRGIGKLVAEFMAQQGANLILHSRDVEHLKPMVEEMKKLGVQAYAVGAELSDEKAVEAMLQTIDDWKVKVEIVMNNAGLQVAYRDDYYQTPVSDYTTSFAINTIAPMMICYHFLPKMIEQGFGRIVNTTSGIQLEPQQAGYSASKAALDKVTVDIGSTLAGTGVAINLTDPGWCRTDLGGPAAPNDPSSALPGVMVGAFLENDRSGRIFSASDFYDMSLEEAVAKAEEIGCQGEENI